jgi:hypothetical protein
MAPSGWYAPVGVNLGASLHADVDAGFVLGAEASMAHWNDEIAFWSGYYADALWDFRTDEFRFSVGPEIGWLCFGLDAGYVGIVRDTTYRHAVQLRPFIALGFVSVYGRWVRAFGDVAERDFAEVGTLIKFPIPAVGD